MIKRKKNYIRLPKHFWIYLLLLMSLFVLIQNSIPKVLAAPSSTETLNQDFVDFLKGFGKTMFERMSEAYKSFEGFLSDDKYNFTKVTTNFIKALGYMMVVILAGLNILKEAQKGDPGIDFWTKVIVTTVIAFMLIGLIDDIMRAIYKLGNVIIDQMQKVFINPEKQGVISLKGLTEGIVGIEDYTSLELNETQQGLVEKMSTLPGLTDLKNVVGNESLDKVNYYIEQKAGGALKVLQYAVWFPMIIGIFLMYSALFEIRIRQLFAPLAVASITSDGARSTGVRFLKKYLGCFMKIAIYFGIAALGTMLTFYFFEQMIMSGSVDVGTEEVAMDMNLIFMIMANVVAGMAMMQSGGLGDEIVGV